MKAQFTTWFLSTWKETGGLISQKIASNILQMSDAGVKKYGDQGKLQTYEFDKTKLYSLTEVLMMKATKEELVAFANMNKLKNENPETYQKTLEKNTPDYTEQDHALNIQEEIDLIEKEDDRKKFKAMVEFLMEEKGLEYSGDEWTYKHKE